MKMKRRNVLLLVVMLCLMLLPTSTAYAKEAKQKVTSVTLDIYYDGKIQIDSLTEGVVVEKITGTRTAEEEWKSLTVTLKPELGYTLKKLRSDAFYFETEDILTVYYVDMVKKESTGKVILELEYYREHDCDYDCDYDYDYDCDEDYWYDEYGNCHLGRPHPSTKPDCGYDHNYHKKGWEYDNGEWYYYENGRKVCYGWKKIDGKWYHFNEENGEAETGWIDYKYYLNPDADDPNFAECEMVTGWREVSVVSGTYWYYFDNVSGAKVTGWMNLDGKWHHFDEQGKLLTK